MGDTHYSSWECGSNDLYNNIFHVKVISYILALYTEWKIILGSIMCQLQMAQRNKNKTYITQTAVTNGVSKET
jgi:hypothetical protein